MSLPPIGRDIWGRDIFHDVDCTCPVCSHADHMKNMVTTLSKTSDDLVALTAERDQLLAEVERLNVEHAEWMQQHDHNMDVLVSQRNALRAEVERLNLAEAEAMSVVLGLEGTVERLRADAERYRWLRDPANANRDEWNAFGPYSSATEIDAAIDAARAGDRTPPQVETLVDALQDRIHTDSGVGRVARSVKVPK